jgi:hypothetical protein
VTITRKGSTKDYSENWAKAFGKKKVQKAVNKPSAKPPAAGAMKKDAKSTKK